MNTPIFPYQLQCAHCGSAHDKLEAGNKCPSCGAPFEARFPRYPRTAVELLIQQERLQMMQREQAIRFERQMFGEAQ